MFTFVHRPFVYFTPLLCLGIILADTYPIQPFYSLFFVVLLILFGIFQGKGVQRKILVFLLGALLITLGSSLIEWRRPGQVNMQAQELVALAEIEEIASTDKDWRRAIVHIGISYEKGEVKPSDESVCILFNSPRVQQGDILAVHLHLLPIVNKGNPGEFDSEAFWNRQNVYRMAFVSEEDFKFVDFHKNGFPHNFWESMRDQCKAVLRSYLTPELAGLAEALILGDKSRLSSEDRAAFSNAGAMHVLAVSGLHVGIVVYLLMFLFARLPRVFSKNQAHLLALILVWVYAFLTGMSPSVQRAAFMFTMLVLSQTYGRRHDSLNVLFFSAFVLLLIDPLLIYDIGFQLSYLAMLGILTMYRAISRLLFIRWKWLRKIWEGTAVGIAAQICTLPLTLYYFHQFPNYFALSNLAVMALAALILGIGILMFTVQFAHWLSSLLGTVLSFLLFVLLFTMQWIEDLPAAVATGFELGSLMVVFCYLAILVYWLFKANRAVRLGMPIVFVVLLGILQYQRYENWNRSELLVFNHRHPVFCVKHADRIWCFFKDRQGVREDAERMLAEYVKLYPGQVKFVPLLEGMTEVKIEQQALKCSLQKELLALEYGELALEIRLTHYAVIDSSKVQLDMPYLPREKDRVSLMDGAFRYSLAEFHQAD